MPQWPAGFIETERADLRPRAPTSLNYTPQVRDVITYRMVDGLSLRRASAYDGGQGPVPRPVVVLFHGASRDELSMIDMWDETARTHGLVLISLKSGGPSWDPNTDDTDVLARALDAAEADIPIDRSRMFLFGHSAGSIYAQLLANRADGPWLAVAGHGGTLPALWVQARDAAPPMRHYLGSSDGLFAPYDARQSSEVLAAAGHHSELVLIPGHTHWFYEGGPAIAEDAWLWFAEMMAEPAG
ncbi:alpha/beta hydrolase [Jannaschia sp. CCS1]|uniref:alpha/beta hydrolase n=1 Tax=Jannaschia sp. (strain CCS1) TaxID=290400 RepID=UPI0005C6B1B0|nr:alpha/beta hydrolase [Jannaschia sp. CCS1]